MSKKFKRILSLVLVFLMVMTCAPSALFNASAYSDEEYFEEAVVVRPNFRCVKETYTDAAGNSVSTTYTYDKNGNLTKEIDGYSSITYTYDENGNLTKEKSKDSDGYSNSITYAYDKNGNLIKRTYNNLEGKYGSTYTYDKNGNLIKESYKDTDGDLGITTYTHDKNGNLTEKIYKSPYGYSSSYTYTYDKNGNLTEETNPGSSTTYTYDKNGNLTKEVYDVPYGFSYTTTYTYDKNGNLTKEKYKDSYDYLYRITYSYDKNGNLTKETCNDSKGGASVTKYAYDKNGNLTKKTFKDASLYSESYEYTYDENGNKTKTVIKCGSNKITYTYEYKKFDLNEKKINDDMLASIADKNYTYSGEQIKPSVTVKNNYGKTQLFKGRDYKVTYSNNKNVGKATVKVKFVNNDSEEYVDYGTVKLYFNIVPASTSLSSVTAKSKGFTAKWKKQSTQTTGYQLQYSTSSKFTDKTTKTVTVKDTKTLTKTVSKLKANTKYYVRIRTYKTVSDKNYYSSWSKAVKVTTKK